MELPSAEMGKEVGGQSRFGRTEQELSFSYVLFETFVGHPTGDTKKAFGNMILDFIAQDG